MIAVAAGEEVSVLIHVDQEPANSPLHRGVHLPGKGQVAGPADHLGRGHDEMRGLLGVARIEHHAVGGDLVDDPAVAVDLVRLGQEEPQRLPGQIEVAGSDLPVQRVGAVGAEPPGIFRQTGAESRDRSRARPAPATRC